MEPRQLGCNGYEVIEFRMCADWRWHKVDAYDRALPGTTAELLDEEALLAALERCAEEAAEAAALAEVQAAEAAYAKSAAGLAAAAAAEAAAAAAASTRSEVGVVGTPDDEMVDNRVRAMQSQLQVGTRHTLCRSTGRPSLHFRMRVFIIVTFFCVKARITRWG
jgi:hypothetical protein